MMTEERMKEIDMMLAEAQTNANNNKDNIQTEVMTQPIETSMIVEQLSLGEELERIDYLLKGYTIERDENTGSTKWVAPTNNEMIVLSEYGVHLIRNTIAWYLNKNTLLSNYDENTILEKMEDFSSDLNDTIFMEYEKIFQYPSPEDCQDVLKDRIKKKVEMKIFSKEILGEKLSEKEKEKITLEIYQEVKPRIEHELRTIKEQIMKNKLKRFLIIIRQVQDAVHSTYLRAWKGQERTTLREHIHISESKGFQANPTVNNAGFSPLAFLRRR